MSCIFPVFEDFISLARSHLTAQLRVLAAQLVVKVGGLFEKLCIDAVVVVDGSSSSSSSSSLA